MSANENSLYEALVLEDDEPQRELSKDMLEMKAGVEVETAESVDQVGSFDYDLVITDYSGVDVEAVYEKADNLIVFSGYPEDSVDVPEEAEYVQKGPGYDELAREVEQQLP
ncbi:MAG: hypothetical protein ABEK00_02885 [Candidatus Nanohaloarchaea archaeon]